MPFALIKHGPNRGKYRSPSGRIFTRRQVKMYHATGGFKKRRRDTFFAVQDSAGCKCGVQHLGLFCDDLSNDARTTLRKRDPSNTLDIRRAYIREFDRRWDTIKRMVYDAIVRQNMFGFARNTLMSVQITASVGGNRIEAFQQWFDNALAQIVLTGDKKWAAAHIRNAYARSWAREVAKYAVTAAMNADRTEAISAYAMTELQGIMEVVSQQAVRAIAEGVLQNLKPRGLALGIRKKIDAIGIVRSRALAQSMIVRAAAEAQLDAFEMAGIRRVGTIPETIPKPPVVKDALTALFDAVSIATVRFRSRTGSEKAPPRRAGLFRAPKEELVNVITAGDDDVCETCEDISDDGPYTLEEARGLIPAHPNCRCAFVPADDDRFAGPDDDDEEE